MHKKGNKFTLLTVAFLRIQSMKMSLGWFWTEVFAIIDVFILSFFHIIKALMDGRSVEKMVSNISMSIWDVTMKRTNCKPYNLNVLNALHANGEMLIVLR